MTIASGAMNAREQSRCPDGKFGEQQQSVQDDDLTDPAASFKAKVAAGLHNWPNLTDKEVEAAWAEGPELHYDPFVETDSDDDGPRVAGLYLEHAMNVVNDNLPDGTDARLVGRRNNSGYGYISSISAVAERPDLADDRVAYGAALTEDVRPRYDELENNMVSPARRLMASMAQSISAADWTANGDVERIRDLPVEEKVKSRGGWRALGDTEIDDLHREVAKGSFGVDLDELDASDFDDERTAGYVMGIAQDTCSGSVGSCEFVSNEKEGIDATTIEVELDVNGDISFRHRGVDAIDYSTGRMTTAQIRRDATRRLAQAGWTLEAAAKKIT